MEESSRFLGADNRSTEARIRGSRSDSVSRHFEFERRNEKGSGRVNDFAGVLP